MGCNCYSLRLNTKTHIHKENKTKKINARKKNHNEDQCKQSIRGVVMIRSFCKSFYQDLKDTKFSIKIAKNTCEGANFQQNC